MKKRTPISTIMTKDPITVNHTNTVNDVVNTFKENDIHHIPVVSGENLIGLISKTDIDRISFITNNVDPRANTQVYDSLTIEQVMTSDLECIQEETTVKEAALRLATGKIHALPVLKGEKLTGIVTSTDIIQLLAESI